MQGLAIRPHGSERIRKWLQALLAEQSVEFRTAPGLAETCPDHEILSTLRCLRADLLILSFQGSRGGNSRPTDGLQMVELIRRDVPWARQTPVLLHVGLFSQIAFANSLGGRVFERLFILNEDEFASDATPGKLRDFLYEVIPRLRFAA
jgi:hypothetical protein